MADSSGQNVAHIGAMKGGPGGRVYVGMPGKPSAVLYVQNDKPSLVLGPDPKQFFIVDSEGLKLINDGKIPVVDLTPKHLKIADDAGIVLFEAGYTADGIGIVRAGPTKGGPPAPGELGFPYQIVGRKPK